MSRFGRFGGVINSLAFQRKISIIAPNLSKRRSNTAKMRVL